MNRRDRIIYDSETPIRDHIGQMAEFRSDIIDIGGALMYNKGQIVFIRDVDCGFYRIAKTRTGKLEYGNWEPKTFNILSKMKDANEI